MFIECRASLYITENLILHFMFFVDIPASMWRLLSNPIYVVTCLGSCMELSIVNGFLVFLPKYLETQFSIGKSQASIFTGMDIFIKHFFFFKL